VSPDCRLSLDALRHEASFDSSACNVRNEHSVFKVCNVLQFWNKRAKKMAAVQTLYSKNKTI
jgi:hypothetical protein